ERLLTSILDLARDNLALGRRMIALTVTHPSPDGRVTRGHRRIAWIELALEPVRGQLPREQYDRLVAALAVLLGWESMIVLRDICGADPDREREVLAWMARTIVREALATGSTPEQTD